MGNFDLESGKRFMQEGELVEALRCFLASIEVDPDDPEAYVALFEAYAAAWHESGDPMVLDQMRKVALAGLKRQPTDEQRRHLEEGLDRTDETILAAQLEEQRAERQEQAELTRRRRRLPMLEDPHR